MTVSDTLLTTGDAASLVNVHDSSIKRWCDGGELTCSYTSGGHRRIALQNLLTYAEAEGLTCPLLNFKEWATDVWKGFQQMQDGSAVTLINLLYEWLEAPHSRLPAHLMEWCLRQDMPLHVLFDEIVAPTLYRIGDNWRVGRLEVGDEHRMTQLIHDALYHLGTVATEVITRSPSSGTAIVGCGENNQHDMGARMIRILLEVRGWEVIYLGGRVPIADFVRQQQQFDASLVCISMTAPYVPSDAQRLIRVLGKLYDADHPFHLVLGGQIVRGLTNEEIRPHPFTKCHMFDSTSAFSMWIETVSVSASHVQSNH